MQVRILTFGTFDLLHADHLRLLRRASTMGELWVGLGTDPYVTQYKRQPITEYSKRAAALEELEWVTGVVPRDKVDASRCILKVGPQFLLVGLEWYGMDYLEATGIDTRFLNEHDIGLIFMPSLHRLHTSDTIAEVIRREGGVQTFKP